MASKSTIQRTQALIMARAALREEEFAAHARAIFQHAWSKKEKDVVVCTNEGCKAEWRYTPSEGGADDDLNAMGDKQSLGACPLK